MLFNSFHFLVFFIISTIIFFIIPHKYRSIFLLVCSCYFYMVFVPIYILILCFIIVIDYFVGLFLETASKNNRKWILTTSIFANIGILSFFKYYNFLNENLTLLIHGIGYQNPIPHLSILLPLGLSFHTFQAMSYTIEVYRGNQKAENNFVIYSLYVMFYPQLVAGPIERPQHMMHQIYKKKYFDYQRVTDGLKLMVWGLFQKVVIADRLAIFVDKVYNNPYEYEGISIIIATFFFSFQIVYDFSGYTNIALGAAEVLGFKLVKNFNRPYHSKNIREFWNRWHISLSSWFRDYLFLPIAYKTSKTLKKEIYYSIQTDKLIYVKSIVITFLLCGLWHGADWTFILWGGVHAFYLICFFLTKNIRKKISQYIGLNNFSFLHNSLQILFTFCLITLAWIFFRAESVSIAFYIITHLFSGMTDFIYNLITFKLVQLHIGISRFEFLILLALISFMEIVHIMQYKYKMRDWIRSKPTFFRWSIYYIAIFIIIFFGIYENRHFIYFQF